jgi:hypothetical protein
MIARRDAAKSVIAEAYAGPATFAITVEKPDKNKPGFQRRVAAEVSESTESWQKMSMAIA